MSRPLLVWVMPGILLFGAGLLLVPQPWPEWCLCEMPGMASFVDQLPGLSEWGPIGLDFQLLLSFLLVPVFSGLVLPVPVVLLPTLFFLQ